MRLDSRLWVAWALGILIVAGSSGCGEKKKSDEDADTEMDVEEDDVSGETAEDPPVETPDDPAVDPTEDPVEDPAGDPVADPVADSPEDPAVEAEDDPAADPTEDDPGEDPTDEDPEEDPVVDAVDEDVPDDALDDDAPPGPPSPGAHCTDWAMVPVSVPADLPFTDASATTCGTGNDYSLTCLGSYDGGEELVYELDVTATTDVNVWIDPKTTGWTGLALDTACPLDATTCTATSTRSAAVVHDLGCQTLSPGSYWIMVDTWPSPACIPDFDLNVHECVCTPGSTSCLDSTTLRVCNDLHSWDEVVCINSCGDAGGGVDDCLATSTETEPNGDATEALTNNLITIPWDGTGEITTGTDEDYFAFTITSPTRVTIQTDAHGTGAIGDTLLWLYESTFTTETPPTCSTTSGCVEFDDNDGTGLYSLIDDRGLPPGTYYVRVTGYSSTYTGTYRLTIWVL